MPPQTWVARFVVDHGRVTEEGGRLRTFPRRRLDEPETDLHLLAEPGGPKGEDFGAQAIETIGREFLNDALSLTGGLLRALRATNNRLLEWNRRSIAKDQVSVGVTAAIVRGSLVYLAQAGPTLVYVRRAGKLSRIAPEAAASVALGDGPVEPELRRFELQPGDLVLAASGDLESVLDRESLEGLLERGTDVALPELYLRTRELPNFALFAISCLEEAAQESEIASPDGEAVRGSDLPAAEAPSDRSAPHADDELAAEGRATAGGSTPRLAGAALPRRPEVASVATISAAQPQLRFGPAPAAAPVSARPAVLVAQPPLDISRPVVKLRSDQFSSRGAYPRTTGPGRAFRFQAPAPGMLGIAAAAALVLLIAAITVPDLIRENRQVQASTLVERALSAFTHSTQVTDKGEQRQLLEETRRLAAEALRIEPENISAAELHSQATASLAVLSNVVNLGAMQTVTTLGRQVTGEVAIDQVAVGGGNAYLLDSRGRRVILVPLAAPSAPVVLFEDGQTYGGTPARRPQFLTWDANSGRLLVLDSERKLFEARPGSVQPLAVRRSSSWASVGGIAAYDGNLYVLDPKGNQIHRYLPAAGGYDSEPQAMLGSQAKIADAVAISVQGDVFIVGQDGRVRRYRNGVETALALAGLDHPISAPAGVAAVPNSDDLFITDNGNKRVVVATRDGVFVRQLVSNAFANLRAVAVDGQAGQIYAVVGDALLAAPLPK